MKHYSDDTIRGILIERKRRARRIDRGLSLLCGAVIGGFFVWYLQFQIGSFLSWVV